MGWSSSSGGSNFPSGIQVPGGSYGNSSIGFGNAPGTGSGLYWSNGLVVIQGGAVVASLSDGGSFVRGIALNGRNSFTPKTSAYNLNATSDDVIACSATTAAFNVTLPSAIANPSKIFTVKKVDASANAVTIVTSLSQTIDGASTAVLSTQWQVIRLISDGSNWLVI